MILIRLKKIKIANPVHTIPNTVAERKLSNEILNNNCFSKLFKEIKLRIKIGKANNIAKIVVKAAISIGELSCIFFTKFADSP